MLAKTKPLGTAQPKEQGLFMEYTKFTAENCILTKTINLVDGEIKKTPVGYMCSGYAERMEAANLSEFDLQLADLKTNQAISIGSAEATKNNKSVPIGIKKNLADNAIARAKDYFHASEGEGLILFDYDPEAGKPAMTPKNVIRTLIDILPELEGCEMLVRASASSGVYIEGEKPESTHGGLHVFARLQQGSDLTRLSEVIHVRSWIKGYGRIEVSVNGSMLVRVFCDQAVHSPERFIFEAPPIIGEGLTFDKPESLYIEGAVFDSTKATITGAERDACELSISKAKELKKPEADKIKAIYKATKSKEICERTSSTVKQAEKCVSLVVEKHKLTPGWFLESATYGLVDVVDLLREPQKFHCEEFIDPLQTGEVNAPYRAMAYVNEDGPFVIHSFRHGKEIYILELQLINVEFSDISKTIQKIEAVLASGQFPNIFNRGGELVKVHSNGKITALTPTTLSVEICKLVKFSKFVSKKGADKPEEVACTLPDKIVKAIYEAGNWGIPNLQAVTRTPFVFKGVTLSKNGYHKSTGIYVAVDEGLKHVA